MDIAEAHFRYPVFGFEPEAILGWQCAGPRDFAVMRENVVRREREALELVDSDGRRWAVRSLRRVGRAGGLVSWLFLTPFGASRCRIAWDLEPMPPVSLSEVQAQACHIAARFGKLDDWNDELKAETADLIARIRGAKTISELAPILEWPSFANY